MKTWKMLLGAAVVLLLVSSAAAEAKDFGWIEDLNVQAKMDASGFQARLATRFQIGQTRLNLVVGSVDKPADAYMVLRLGEIARKPPEEVMKVYKEGKGWGVLAKSLGIKPGSREFQALKKGHDLDRKPGKKGKGKGKEKD